MNALLLQLGWDFEALRAIFLRSKEKRKEWRSRKNVGFQGEGPRFDYDYWKRFIYLFIFEVPNVPSLIMIIG